MQTLERRVISWLLSDDTGASSQAICAHMMGEACEGDYPHDPSDLGRCLRLLDRVPEFQSRIREMAVHGPGWAGLIENWDTIVHLYHHEDGQPPEHRPQSPQTYKALKLAEADGYRKDPRYKCGFSEEGTILWTRLIAEESDEVVEA